MPFCRTQHTLSYRSKPTQYSSKLTNCLQVVDKSFFSQYCLILVMHHVCIFIQITMKFNYICSINIVFQRAASLQRRIWEYIAWCSHTLTLLSSIWLTLTFNGSISTHFDELNEKFTECRPAGEWGRCQQLWREFSGPNFPFYGPEHGPGSGWWSGWGGRVFSKTA